eukprot:4319360-Pleurochrysis_carterae.AAC.1
MLASRKRTQVRSIEAADPDEPTQIPDEPTELPNERTEVSDGALDEVDESCGPTLASAICAM